MFAIGATSGGQPHSPAHASQLLEHLVEPVGQSVDAQPVVEARDQSGGQPVLGGADGVPRRERRHRHVAERGVDELAGLPESRDVDTGFEPDAGERLRERLGRRPVERDRDGIDRAPDRRRAAACRLDRGCERPPGGTLAEQADGQPARLPHPLDELAGVRGVERARPGR